jgi:hypothetical protein
MKPNPLTARIIRLEQRRPMRRHDEIAEVGQRLIAATNALKGATPEELRAWADHVRHFARQAGR